jgi:hypothetical protein
MSRRWRMIGYGSAAALVAAGAACAVLVGGLAGELLVIGLVSLGLLVAVALVFLEIGFSEERELAREAESRRARAKRAFDPRKGRWRKRRPD